MTVLLLLNVLVAVSASESIDSWHVEIGESSDGVHTMSSQHSNANRADRGNDGDTNGLLAHSAGSTKNPWIQTDMKSSRQVGKVDVYNSVNAHAYRLTASDGALVSTECNNTSAEPRTRAH